MMISSPTSETISSNPPTFQSLPLYKRVAKQVQLLGLRILERIATQLGCNECAIKISTRLEELHAYIYPSPLDERPVEIKEKSVATTAKTDIECLQVYHTADWIDSSKQQLF